MGNGEANFILQPPAAGEELCAQPLGLGPTLARLAGAVPQLLPQTRLRLLSLLSLLSLLLALLFPVQAAADPPLLRGFFFGLLRRRPDPLERFPIVGLRGAACL